MAKALNRNNLAPVEASQVDDAKQKELFEACHRGFADVARTLLLTEHVDVNAAYDRARHIAVGGSVRTTGATCLRFAATQGQAETVDMLLKDFHADVDRQDADGCSALHFAADKDHLEIVRLLFEDGKANLNLGDKQGTTPLMKAVTMGRIEVVRYLLKHGAKVNETDRDGNTALALANGDEIRKLLLRHGATSK